MSGRTSEIQTVRDDIDLARYEEDTIEALSIYDSMLGVSLHINVNDAARLVPTPDQPYTARSDSAIWHAGGVAARLSVIAFAPHDGTGRGSDEQRHALQIASGYRYRPDGPARHAVMPWQDPSWQHAGVTHEMHLTLLAHDLSAGSGAGPTADEPEMNDEPVLLAGSLDGMGLHFRNHSVVPRLAKVATIGQREPDFLNVMYGSATAQPTATVTLGANSPEMPQAWWFSRERAYVNPLSHVLQIAGFVTIDLRQYQEFGDALAGLEPKLPAPLQPLA